MKIQKVLAGDPENKRKFTLVEDLIKIRAILLRSTEANAKIQLRFPDSPTQESTAPRPDSDMPQNSQDVRDSQDSSDSEEEMEPTEKNLRGQIESIDEPNQLLTLFGFDETTEALLQEKLAEGKTADVLMVIFIPPQIVVSFKTTISLNEDGQIQVRCPRQIFQVQRRKYTRYTIPRGYEIEVAFRHPDDRETIVKHRLVDLAAGGLSFQITRAEKEKFEKGLYLKHMQLTLRGHPMIFDVEVQNQIPHRINAQTIGYKVGVRFRRIIEADIEYISSYILEHSFQYARLL